MELVLVLVLVLVMVLVLDRQSLGVILQKSLGHPLSPGLLPSWSLVLLLVKSEGLDVDLVQF
jgi:hypothetical protein